MAISAIHYNHNLLCAVSIITTGPDPAKHDLMQVCVLPLDSRIVPRKDVMPFDINLQPRRITNINDLHEQKKFNVPISRIIKYMNDGINYYDGVKLFDHWFHTALKPNPGKKIMILGSEWYKAEPFLRNWLNEYDYYFHSHVRDISVAALYANDRADLKVEKIPYPKNYLCFLASRMELEYDYGAKEALEDVQRIAEIYFHMLRNMF